MKTEQNESPYVPAVGELVIGDAIPTGGLAIGTFTGLDRRYNMAIIHDGLMVLAVEPQSLRPAPPFPDASHLIGQEVTGGTVAGNPRYSLTGVVSEIHNPTADGAHVRVKLDWGHIVLVERSYVEATAPSVGS